jgi:hypothetical protein
MGSRAMERNVRVFHRRRAFPGLYLRQRWRYRVKTGRMQIDAFLFAGFLGVKATRLPLRWGPVIPFAFAMHHLTYWLGIETGLIYNRGIPSQSR